MGRLLAVGLVTAGVLGMPWAAPGATAAAGDGFRILDDRVRESSGLVLSRAHPHTVWTANDSGDSARLFAVDTRTGRTTGVHTFGARVVDVEGLAITPQGQVLVADIGDNTRTRQVVRIFWFDEPALGETSGSWASWELAYPDGPHDAESVAVDPRSGRVLLVTKGSDGAVYSLPTRPSRQGVNRLERLAAAPAVATDAVFLADGSALAVRTYTQLVLLDPRTWHPTVSSLLPLQRQGETLALAPDGSGLLIGTEGSQSRVQPVAVPVTPPAAGTPTGAATPTATPTAAGTPAPAPTATPTATPTSGVTGPVAPATTPGAVASASSGVPPVQRGPSGWLLAALGVSVGLALAAAAVTLRRTRAAR